MPVGVIINALSVVFGGIVGALAGKKLTAEFKANLTLVFGVCSMGMGISSIGLMKYMPAVIFAVVIGTGIGLACILANGSTGEPSRCKSHSRPVSGPGFPDIP